MRDLNERGTRRGPGDFQKPFLGLCLGMQLLFDFSEEGNVDCLGIIRGQVKRLPDDVTKPHMGWNQLDTGQYVYFAHSYYCVPDDPRIITTSALHGVVFCAGVRQRNFFGVQWHPEKSSESGDRLLRSFAALCQARGGADILVCQEDRETSGRQESVVPKIGEICHSERSENLAHCNSGKILRCAQNDGPEGPPNFGTTEECLPASDEEQRPCK